MLKHDLQNHEIYTLGKNTWRGKRNGRRPNMAESISQTRKLENLYILRMSDGSFRCD